VYLKNVFPNLNKARCCSNFWTNQRSFRYRLHSAFTEEQALSSSEIQIKRHEIRLAALPQKQHRQSTMESLFPLKEIKEAECLRDYSNGETVYRLLRRIHQRRSNTAKFQCGPSWWRTSQNSSRTSFSPKKIKKWSILTSLVAMTVTWPPPQYYSYGGSWDNLRPSYKYIDRIVSEA